MITDKSYRTVETVLTSSRAPNKAELSDSLIDELEEAITPTSFSGKLAQRVSAGPFRDWSRRTLRIEASRQYNTHETERVSRIVGRYLSKYKSCGIPEEARSNLSVMTLEDLRREFQTTVDLAHTAKQRAKKTPLNLHTINVSKGLLGTTSTNEKIYGIFKKATDQQIRGELTSFLISLLTQLPFAHPVVRMFVWSRELNEEKRRTMGVFSKYHDSHTPARNVLDQSEGLKAFEALHKDLVHGLVLMHLVRGSEDAHPRNSLVRIKTDPQKGELVIDNIIEIDGEHIMAIDGPDNPRFTLRDKHIACMRIWWLGLQQCDLPFSTEILQLINTWKVDDFRQLIKTLGFYEEDRVESLISRLNKIKKLAKEELSQSKITLTPRALFASLIYNHPTLAVLASRGTSPLEIYNLVGGVSIDEVDVQGKK